MNPARHPFNDELTTAESEVLNLLFKGLTTEEIAAVLGKAFKTVEHDISRMLLKTGTRNSRELIYEALERKWLVPPSDVAAEKSLEVLKLLFKGLTIPEIANICCRAPKTVERRIMDMMKKTDSRNSRGLIYKALRSRLILPPMN